MKYIHWVVPTYVLGLSYSMHLHCAAIGRLDSQSTIDDSARVCMSIGLQASLTNLEDFQLAATNAAPDGSAGALYVGSDSFQLDSNGQVAVLVNDGALANGDYVVKPDYTIDESGYLITLENSSHTGEHTISGSYRIREISGQLAGDYQGLITLTVTPGVGGGSGCGETIFTYPSAGVWGTMMWEDLYPNAGDADYNDLVLHFRIEEEYGANEELESITIDYVPVARGAGYNHSLELSLDGTLRNSRNISTDTTPVFVGDATVKVSHINLRNNQIHERHYELEDDITIFNSSLVAVGDMFQNVYSGEDLVAPAWATRVEVEVDSSSVTELNTLASGDFNYRTLLHVNNTNSDIDLVEINQQDGMVDANGYPFGLVVPADVYWPTERTSIEEVYPLFTDYIRWINGEVEELSDDAATWYDFPAPDSGQLLMYYELEQSISDILNDQ